ncbi:MAG: Na+/H+ antiporter subunit E [Defluviitaleaceae bacterium]|nr:Na+/H+ antiporter subunit E [Defluviitaleaceae bacterium]
MRILVLVAIWIMLREEITVFDLILGSVISVACMAYSHRFLPVKKIEDILPLKLFLYLLHLIGQAYVAGFQVIKMILVGNVRADVVATQTTLKNESLRVMLVDSIAITPGSVPLDLSDDIITALILKYKTDPRQEIDDSVKGNLEVELLKAQK